MIVTMLRPHSPGLSIWPRQAGMEYRLCLVFQCLIVPVITVDGPSGTGKGTICSYLADWLHWHFLDSGALVPRPGIGSRETGYSISDDDAALSALGGEFEGRIQSR